MALKLVEFDGVSLPEFEAEQSVGTAPVESALINTIGGVYDYWGTRTRKARRYSITAAGYLVGETQYLVDEEDNIVVDESGNPVVSGSAANHLRSQLQALRAKVGTRATLWRERLDDPETKDWLTARLLTVDWQRARDEMIELAKITCVFDSAMVAWRTSSPVSVTETAADGVPEGILLPVSGDAIVDDAIITVTRTSGTITALEIVCSAMGIDLEWAGSLGASDVLVIDAGAATVRKNGADAYSGLAWGTGHTASGWFPLTGGMISCTATVTGGNATVNVTYYDQFL
jgi:hypothetical protein